MLTTCKKQTDFYDLPPYPKLDISSSQLPNSFRLPEEDESAKSTTKERMETVVLNECQDTLLEKMRNISIDDGINEPLIQKPEKKLRLEVR